MGLPATIGRYRVLRELGRGGMGVVYAAYDAELGRDVAIKILHRGADAAERERLRREARAAAGISHPGICQLHEIGEAGGELYIAMELVEGESLSARIARGPVSPREAADLTIAILDALDAVHRRGIVHRDLKPSNVIIAPHGVKLLDFGLARGQTAAADATAAVTLPGLLVGTPRYMAPEQAQGHDIDARTDIFAVGCILFEMLAQRPAFEGDTVAEAVHAVVYDRAPVLTGSAAIVALDRIVHQALAKHPADRYQTASAMREALRALSPSEWSSGSVQAVRAMTRLIVVPFRMLRPDADIDFLTFSLADAVASSLAGLQSLVVRSTAAAPIDPSGPPDFKRLAEEADVDVALVGTILRAGDKLRVASQLVEVPAGTVLWSHTAQVAIGDIFQLQDDLAQRIVESLSVPLTAREQRMLHHDVPATARAFEFYLRGNQLSIDPKSWTVARDLYRRCLEEDPRYAPAWARLGRVCRVLAKYRGNEDPSGAWVRESEEALARALELNPDLPLAHYVYSQVEVDAGHAERAMVRLIERSAQAPDPHLFAGLVQACRYCGLLAASVEAHHQARRLDRTQPTTIVHTLWAMGDYEGALEAARNELLGYMLPVVLATMGRTDEAVERLRGQEGDVGDVGRRWYVSLRAALDGHCDESIEACESIVASNMGDPESLYYLVRTFAMCGRTERALQLFARTVDEGFFCEPLFARDRWIDSLRSDPRFVEIASRAAARHRQASDAFDRAGGARLLRPAMRVS
jgi:eukaryotic-like serine/threonine-protein kinase